MGNAGDRAIQRQNHNFAHLCCHKIIQLTDMFQFLNARTENPSFGIHSAFFYCM